MYRLSDLLTCQLLRSYEQFDLVQLKPTYVLVATAPMVGRGMQLSLCRWAPRGLRLSSGAGALLKTNSLESVF